MKRVVIFFIIICGFVFSNGALSQGPEIKFESCTDYINATPQQLEEEKMKIGDQLSKFFKERSIESKQIAITFSDYQANLRNLLLYSTKLAGYYNYEELLKFGKDKAWLKTLSQDYWTDEERQAYVDNKYKEMKKNIEMEIATYEDFINTSLDACLAMNNDFFFRNKVVKEKECRLKMEEFFKGKVYQDYISNKDILQRMRPKLIEKIEDIVAIWGKTDTDPEALIISKEIVDKL